MHDQPSPNHRRSGARAALALAPGLGLGCLDTSTEVVVEGSHPIYASVVAGLRHSCALDVDGYAYCWGFNGQGELGVPQGGGVGRGPEPLPRSLRFVQLAAGNSFTCGLSVESDVYCWGWPSWAILPGPTRIETELELTSVVAGANHVCGVLSAGGIACWGLGAFGQLGNGRVGDGSDEDTPVAVAGLGDVSLTSAGATSTCALDAAGTAWCWGAHDTGQLGVGTLEDGPCAESGTAFPCTALPVSVEGVPALGDLAVGLFHACGLSSAGGVWCWGDDGDGQLGPDDATELCVWMPPADVERACARTPVHVFGGSASFERVYAGGFHACGLTDAAEAFCWGADFLGQLGFGGGTIPDGPRPVWGDQRWVGLGLGQAHTCGVTDAGELYCWGDGRWDQLGAGKEFAPTPVRVLPIR